VRDLVPSGLISISVVKCHDSKAFDKQNQSIPGDV